MDRVDVVRPSLVRQAVVEMEEYSPPEDAQRLARRLGLPLERIVKLDANENPYGCSPRVPEALARFTAYHLYPDPDQEEVRDMVARYACVPSEHIMLGNGSDELIDLIMRMYLDPGDEVLTFSPTFGMYAYNAQHFDARVVDVPRGPAFEVDVDAAIAAIGPRTKLIILASPNNPTGNLVSREEIDRLLATGLPVLVDEAYAEFAGDTLADKVPEIDNLIVLRTFSKWAGLAGLRVGYGVLPRPVARYLWKLKPPFNVNLAAVVAVRESLKDVDYLMGNVRKLIQERERLYRGLAALPFLRAYPSRANFVLCDLTSGDAVRVREALAQRGILVRYYRTPRLANALRFTVGLPDHTDILLAALRDIASDLQDGA